MARTRNCYMLAIQQLAGINRIEDAAECAPIARLSTCFQQACGTSEASALAKSLSFSLLHIMHGSAHWQTRRCAVGG